MSRQPKLYRCHQCDEDFDNRDDPCSESPVHENHMVCPDCFDQLEAQRDREEAQNRDDLHRVAGKS